MPEIAKYEKNTVLRRFTRKRIYCYLIPNVVFNACIAYFSFIKPGVIYLFTGDQSVARILLPMSFLLPFIITFDILKRTMVLAEQQDIDLILSNNFRKNRFMFQIATINGFCTVTAVFAIMLMSNLLLPQYYHFKVIPLTILDGSLAGIYSILFTLLPIKKLKKRALEQADIPVSV